MTGIIIKFDVDPVIDPTLVDPLDIAEAVLDAFQEWQRAQPLPQPEVAGNYLEAEWDQEFSAPPAYQNLKEAHAILSATRLPEPEGDA